MNPQMTQMGADMGNPSASNHLRINLPAQTMKTELVQTLTTTLEAHAQQTEGGIE